MYQRTRTVQTITHAFMVNPPFPLPEKKVRKAVDDHLDDVVAKANVAVVPRSVPSSPPAKHYVVLIHQSRYYNEPGILAEGEP